jgi:hypothetical protein
MKKFLVLIGAMALLVPLSAASASSERHGALHVTKECSENTGLADTWCTITSSNLDAITPGSRVVYLQANDAAGNLDSDIVLVVGPGNVALGHCIVSAANVGGCTFSGGTGRFTHFHASVVLSSLGGPNFAWDGWYRFGGHD